MTSKRTANFSAIKNIDAELDRFADKKILITGATGLIGKRLVNLFIEISKYRHIPLTIVAQGRAAEKLHNQLANIPTYGSKARIEYWPYDISKTPSTQPQNITHIIHCASPTSSASFITNPVEVIDSIYQSTLHTLSLASSQSVESYVYASSMEVYGEVCSEKLLSEEEEGYLSPSSLRSSYPQAKRLAELLCVAHAKEKNTPAKIGRLSMVYGVGANPEDKRVLNYFVNQLTTQKDIILKTSGNSKASVLDLDEACEGLMLLLLKGQDGEIYNLSNPQNFMSIREMANVAAKLVSETKVLTEKSIVKLYPNETSLNLDISKMKGLGWSPKTTLTEIFSKTLSDRLKTTEQH